MLYEDRRNFCPCYVNLSCNTSTVLFKSSLYRNSHCHPSIRNAWSPSWSFKRYHHILIIIKSYVQCKLLQHAYFISLIFPISLEKLRFVISIYSPLIKVTFVSLSLYYPITHKEYYIHWFIISHYLNPKKSSIHRGIIRH